MKGLRVPIRIARDIFGNENTRNLLVSLRDNRELNRYSIIRDELGFDSETMKRTIESLEECALVSFRVPDEERIAYIEPTVLGKIYRDLLLETNYAFERIVNGYGIPITELKNILK